MKKILSSILILSALHTSTLTAKPLVLTYEESMVSLLIKHKRENITLKLSSGVELTGTINKITQNFILLHSLEGRESYDAVVFMKDIQAIIIKTK